MHYFHPNQTFDLNPDACQAAGGLPLLPVLTAAVQNNLASQGDLPGALALIPPNEKTCDYKKAYGYEKIALANSGAKPDVTVVKRYHLATEKVEKPGTVVASLSTYIAICMHPRPGLPW